MPGCLAAERAALPGAGRVHAVPGEQDKQARPGAAHPKACQHVRSGDHLCVPGKSLVIVPQVMTLCNC